MTQFKTKHSESKKNNELFSALLVKFTGAKGKGHHVEFNWFWSKARVIYQSQLNDATAITKEHVIITFFF